MVKEVTLLEPGEAIPKNRGYVGVADAGGKIVFPHVDSCCALAFILQDGTLIGGHLGAQWPGTKGVNYVQNGMRVERLMQENRKRLGDKSVTTVVSVGPGNWGEVKQKVWAECQVMRTLNIDTEKHGGGGVDVTVSAGKVKLDWCKDHFSKEFSVPQQDEYKDEQARH